MQGSTSELGIDCTSLGVWGILDHNDSYYATFSVSAHCHTPRHPLQPAPQQHFLVYDTSPRLLTLAYQQD